MQLYEVDYLTMEKTNRFVSKSTFSGEVSVFSGLLVVGEEAKKNKTHAGFVVHLRRSGTYKDEWSSCDIIHWFLKSCYRD